MKTAPGARRTTPFVLCLALALGVFRLPVPAAPTLMSLPEYVAEEGADIVAVIRLDDVAEDPEAPDEALVWRVPEQTTLDVTLTRDRHLVVRSPDFDWFGAEAILLAVCNPDGACATQTISFRVDPVPDAPIIDWIPAQVIGEDDEFRTLDLRPFGFDPDGDTDLVWTASGGTWLSPYVADGVLHVLRCDPAWRGTEELELCVADSTGRTARRTLSCTVTDGAPVVLTFVPNRPIFIDWGSTRIAIDGLLRDVLSLSSRDKERLARAEPPFDGIDLALATHEHYDHVTPRVVVDYLTRCPSMVFASLTETVDLLCDVPGYERIADRIVGIPYSQAEGAELDLAGARVTVYAVRHSGAGNNLAFLVDVGGVKILALGDAAFDFTPAELVASYDWPSLDIDVAVVPARWLEVLGGALVTRGIAPRLVVAGPLRECPPRLDTGDAGRAPVVVCSPVETLIVPPRGP